MTDKPSLIAAMTLFFSLYASLASGEDTVCFLNSDQPGRDVVGDALPNGAIMRFGTTRFLHPQGFDAMAVSPDDRWAVTMGDRLLVVWDTKTGAARWKRSGVPNLNSGYGQCVIAFTSDSKFFYTPDSSSGLVRWEVETGEKTTVDAQWPPFFNGARPLREIRSIDVASNGTRMLIGFQSALVCVSAEHQVLWSIQNQIDAVGMLRRDFNGRSDRLWFPGHYCYSKWTPDGKHAVASFSEAPKTIRVLTADEGELIQEIQATANVIRFAISPNGQSVVTTERDCGARCYSLGTGEKLWEFTVQPHPRSESYFTGVDISHAHRNDQSAALA